MYVSGRNRPWSLFQRIAYQESVANFPCDTY
jgi:hypothetical protein